MSKNLNHEKGIKSLQKNENQKTGPQAMAGRRLQLHLAIDLSIYLSNESLWEKISFFSHLILSLSNTFFSANKQKQR